MCARVRNSFPLKISRTGKNDHHLSPPISLSGRNAPFLPSIVAWMGAVPKPPLFPPPLKKDEKTAPATFMRRDLYFFLSRGIFLRFPVFSLRGNNGNKRGEERRKERKGLKTQFSDPFSWVGRPVFFKLGAQVTTSQKSPHPPHSPYVHISPAGGLGIV